MQKNVRRRIVELWVLESAKGCCLQQHADAIDVYLHAYHQYHHGHDSSGKFPVKLFSAQLFHHQPKCRLFHMSSAYASLCLIRQSKEGTVNTSVHSTVDSQFSPDSQYTCSGQLIRNCPVNRQQARNRCTDNVPVVKLVETRIASRSCSQIASHEVEKLR